MVRLELSPTDARILGAVLENYLSELGMEIADTDSMDFRDKLKARREVIRGVIAQIREAPGA